MMRDYHRWMDGVDVHDQLRLQRYSLQQQTTCKKYYKAVFMGLVNVAIVNAYIVYRETHAEFLTRLQVQMLELTEADFEERQPVSDTPLAIPTTLPTEHVPRESPDFKLINGQHERRQRQCNVCSNRKRHVGERRATKYYCPRCSPSDKARMYLCNKHREAGCSAGKRKRRHRQASSARESLASEQEAADSNVENSERAVKGDEDLDHEREEADVDSDREREKESVEDVTPSSPEQSNNS
ncbi:Hypothetical protein PHPALM_36187 [Phytophthora palmivora]|uniref:PiggyBac transposable element-derived protein domain-containing protein n=1 Tax=Phytophthora palmivora TaxID=4796 RepID=A0A2P4X0L1_9STRA|nr:Hypothetical protein PHPALM_36187 [Phytophthora palmivora]